MLRRDRWVVETQRDVDQKADMIEYPDSHGKAEEGDEQIDQQQYQLYQP